MEEATERVLLYLAYERSRRLRHKTLRSKKAAIKKCLELQGRPDLTSNPRIVAFLNGAEKIDSSGPQLRKLPVTTTHLHVLHRSINFQHRQGSALWATAMLGFCFMLRVSNIAAPSSRSYNVKYILCRRDVRFFGGKDAATELPLSEATLPSIARIEITVKKSKTDQLERGFTRSLRCTGHPYLCVVTAVARHLLASADLPDTWPVSAYDPAGSSGAAAAAVITRGLLARVTKAVGKHLGEDPGSFGTHSYRIGGATAYHAAGMPEAQIMNLGNWRSAAYLVYCWSIVNGPEFLERAVTMAPIINKGSFWTGAA